MYTIKAPGDATPICSEAMEAIRPPTAADHQINRLQIARILKSEDLLAGIKVNIDGRLRALSISWSDYWTPFSQRLVPVAMHLDVLRSVRKAYIRSGFSLRLARPYCHAYFSLLQFVLAGPLDQPSDERFLRAILGFECAAVRWLDQSATSAAVTTNARNPVYLLAKLREPRAYDDPKFLPQITVSNPSQKEDNKASRFYHYRQIIIDKEEGVFLLVYPTVEVSDRLESGKPRRNAALCPSIAEFRRPLMDLQKRLSLFPEEVSLDSMIQGLTFISDYIDEPAHDRLIKSIDLQPWEHSLKRRVQQYGYKYDYKSRAIDATHALGPLPTWADQIASLLQHQGLLKAAADQVIVNEYLPGQGIASHIDRETCF